MSLMPWPTAVTVPALLYPNAPGWSRRLRTADTVAANPSLLILLRTSRTRSGRMRAFCRRLLLGNSDQARSVPAETRDAAVRTSTHPSSSFGAGTSTTVISALRASWKTCLILFPLLSRTYGILRFASHSLKPSVDRPQTQFQVRQSKLPVPHLAVEA